MKENSYDGKGLKFGILVSELFPLKQRNLEDFSKDIDYKKYVQDIIKTKIVI